MMNIPIDCPICGDALVNEFLDHPGKSLHYKRCEKRLDHKFFVRVDDDKLYRFTLKYEGLTISWWFCDPAEDLRYVSIVVGEKLVPQMLPFVEPDFSDPKKLIRQLNTLLILC